MKKLQSSPRTQLYQKLANSEVHDRCYEIYRNLGLWLWEKSDQAIQERYNDLGERRCEEGIPLAQVEWALILTKERLLEYLEGCGIVDSAMDLYQQQEFLRLITHFFDRALCYTAEGYERQASEKTATGGEGALRPARKLWPQPSHDRQAHPSR
ncbi:MAG: hypothetical protein WAK48_32515 [Candidatus Acidiferrum sp.]